jgi:hypothetical protein
VVDAASAVQADDAVTTGQHHQECAGYWSFEKEDPFDPARNGYIADDRRAWRGLSKRDGEWSDRGKREQER